MNRSKAAAQGAAGIVGMLAIGPTLGTGGEYYERRGLAAVPAVAGVVWRPKAGPLPLGVSASMLGNLNAGDNDCLLVPGRATCLPRLPFFVGTAPALGWILGGRLQCLLVGDRVGVKGTYADSVMRQVKSMI